MKSLTTIWIIMVFSLRNASADNVKALSFSPDGKRVTYVLNDEKGESLWLLVGNEKRKMTGYFENITSISCSAQNESLLYSKDGEIWLLKISDGTEESVGEGGKALLSPRGKWIALEKRGAIYVRKLPDGKEIKIGKEEQCLSLSSWKKENVLLLCTGEGDLVQVDLLKPAEMQTLVKHQSMQTRNIYAVYSPDCMNIALVSDDLQVGGGHTTSIWLAGPAGSNQRPALENNSSSPYWLSASELVYKIQGRIEILNVNTGRKKEIGRGEVFTLSPRGDRIAYASRKEDTNNDGSINWQDTIEVYIERLNKPRWD